MSARGTFALPIGSFRGGLRKAVLFPHIVCRVYLSDLAKTKAFLKYCSYILGVLLYCCFKTTLTDKLWKGDFEFFIQDDSLFRRFPREELSLWAMNRS